MGGDVLYPLAHQHTRRLLALDTPLPDVWAYSHLRLIPAWLERPAAVACTDPPQARELGLRSAVYWLHSTPFAPLVHRSV